MNCKECIHYDACNGWANESVLNHYLETYGCDSFESTEKYIKAPYNIGDTVWYITGIHNYSIKPAVVKEMTIDSSGVYDLFVKGDTCSFENSIDIFYPTKEKAEKALERLQE